MNALDAMSDSHFFAGLVVVWFALACLTAWIVGKVARQFGPRDERGEFRHQARVRRAKKQQAQS
jgi:hypothetical protein